jgi:hypothetical protein
MLYVEYEKNGEVEYIVVNSLETLFLRYTVPITIIKVETYR